MSKASHWPGAVGENVHEAVTMSEDEIAEGALPSADVVRARVRTALGYLRAAKPGQRLAALIGLHCAATDMEGLTDWRIREAKASFRLLPSPTRAALRGIVGSLADDPDRVTRGVAQTVYERLIELETAVAQRKRVRRAGRFVWVPL